MGEAGTKSGGVEEDRRRWLERRRSPEIAMEMVEEDGWRSVEGVDRRGWRCCVPTGGQHVGN